MGINVLHHVTVRPTIFEAMRDFYRDLWGLEFGRERNRSALRLR
jgi:catechol 2,3-dioxygenase-like lactoylglutathione lyase family enzyme